VNVSYKANTSSLIPDNLSQLYKLYPFISICSSLIITTLRHFLTAMVDYLAREPELLPPDTLSFTQIHLRPFLTYSEYSYSLRLDRPRHIERMYRPPIVNWHSQGQPTYFLFPFLSFINVWNVTNTLNSDAEKQRRRCWKQSNTNQLDGILEESMK